MFSPVRKIVLSNGSSPFYDGTRVEFCYAEGSHRLSVILRSGVRALAIALDLDQVGVVHCFIDQFLRGAIPPEKPWTYDDVPSQGVGGLAVSDIDGPFVTAIKENGGCE